MTETPDAAAELARLTTLRPEEDWTENMGSVLWWYLPNGYIEEPPYCGSPLDTEWPGYHTHWTPLPQLQADPLANAPPLPSEPCAPAAPSVSDLAREAVWQIHESALRSQIMAMTQGFRRSGENVKANLASQVYSAAQLLAAALHDAPDRAVRITAVGFLVADMMAAIDAKAATMEPS